MHYFRIQGQPACSMETAYGQPTSAADVFAGDGPVYVLVAQPGTRDAFVVNHAAQLGDLPESEAMLSSFRLDAAAQPPLPEALLDAIAARRVIAVNTAYADWQERLATPAASRQQRVHVLALGNVGANAVLAMTLLGAEVIDTIGIYDMQAEQMQRWALEINQIAWPTAERTLPDVVALDEADLFACDVFVFAASAAVPEPGQEQGDVRLMQLEKNTAILAHYVRQAVQADFQGRFVVLSDPVESLCAAAYALSHTDASGAERRGLRPSQIVGFGLGVMHGRAHYFSRRQTEYASYLTHGRAYGRHGQGLVLSLDPTAADDHLSAALTSQVEAANMEIRALGFKPYVAPAVSSGAMSLIQMLRGEWFYGSTHMGGIYFGARVRQRFGYFEVEHLPMQEALFRRIQASATGLRAETSEGARS